MKPQHPVVERLERAAFEHTRRLLARRDPGAAHARNQARYEALRTSTLEYLVVTLREASDACHAGHALMWALEAVPDLRARTVSLDVLVLERINMRIAEMIDRSWADGSGVLPEAVREDQMTREELRVRDDFDTIEGRIQLARDGLQQPPVGGEVVSDLGQTLLECLSGHPNPDLREVASLMSDSDMSGAWTPVAVLQEIARLRANSERLSNDARAHLSTAALVGRTVGLPDVRLRWTVLGLRSLSEVHWALLGCCSPGGSNDPDEVRQRFEETTGSSVSVDEVIAASTWIRTRALIPFGGDVSGEEAEESDVLIADVAAMLPDSSSWDADPEFRANSLLEAMSAAIAELPGPGRLERRGSVALLAASLAGLDPERACEFARENDPGFKPPKIDPTRTDPTETYRKRLTDVLARQPALSAFFARNGTGRRRRRDAMAAGLVS